jgi:protein involved in temperature-dependent protein secretion
MQNSLERLFDGIAGSLREDVAPAVDDPYAKAQVAAAIELLANLAARVEWRSDLLREEIERIRIVLGTARELPAVLAAPVPADSAGLLASRAAHLDALAHADTSEEETRALLSWQVERELGLLRTGMYK